jgi:hypothetical protein
MTRQRLRRRYDAAPGNFDIDNPPSEGEVLEGTVFAGTASNTSSCDGTTWDITETASGVDIKFTFSVGGNGKKINLRGRSDATNTYTIKVYNASTETWDDVDTVELGTSATSHEVDISSQYTYNNRVLVRVYKATGTADKIYLDCISVLAPEGVILSRPSNLYGFAWDLPAGSQAPLVTNFRELWLYWASAPSIVFQTNRRLNDDDATTIPMTISAGYEACVDGTFPIDSHTTVSAGQWMVGTSYYRFRPTYRKTSAQSYTLYIVMENPRAWLSDDGGVTGTWHYAYYDQVVSAETGWSWDLDISRLVASRSGTGAATRIMNVDIVVGGPI